MKRLILLTFLFLLLLSAFLSKSIYVSSAGFSIEDQMDSFRLVSKHVDENERCFSCHDRSVETTVPGEASAIDSLKLEEHQIITRQEFYISNHKSLACIDCHADPTPESPDRTTKEAAVSRTCNDCHQYIKEHAHYNFALIEKEFMQSIHYQRKQAEFNCWKCHDAHKYRTIYRNTDDIYSAIEYDNAVCLSCHKDAAPLSIAEDKEMKENQEMHKWLPDIEEHFEGIRCLDCHTKINESILVAHLVLPGESGVRKCGECHSPNSIMLLTLYKKQSAENLSDNGLFNSVVRKNIYVLGANRSDTLNKICLSILGLIFCGILVHMIPRIIIKQKS